LRERRDDIPLLVSTFIAEANYAYKKEVRGVSPEVMKQLMSHDWPGNIRELKWCINRAVAITVKDIVHIEDTAIETKPDKVPSGQDGVDYSIPFAEAMGDLEKKYIVHAFSLAANNKTKAANILGISVRALHYKLKIHGL
jgi:DNA-binding NtrC family response regulator